MPFSPLSIDPNAVWLDADGSLYQNAAGSTPATADDDPMRNWDDAGPNDYDAVGPSDGTRPLVYTDFDSRKSLKFDPGTKYLDLPAGLSLNKQGYSLYVVSRGAELVPIDLGAGNQSRYFFSFDQKLNLYDAASGVYTTTGTFGIPTHGYCVHGYRAGPSNVKFRAGILKETYGTPLAAGTITGGRIGFDVGAADGGWYGKIRAVVICPTLLSDANDDAMVAGLESLYAVPSWTNQLIVDGDSLSTGYTSADAVLGDDPNYQPTDAQRARIWSWLLARKTNFSAWKIVNNAHSSYTINDLTTNNLSRTLGMYSSTFGATNQYVVLFAGTNDIKIDGVSGATCFSRLTTYAGSLHSAGYRVIVCTMLSRGNFSAGNESARQAFNTSVRAGDSSFYAVCDLDAVSGIGGVGAYSNATYYDTDTIHLTQAGYQAVADAIEATLSPATTPLGFIPWRMLLMLPWDEGGLAFAPTVLGATTTVSARCGLRSRLESVAGLRLGIEANAGLRG